MKIIGEHFLFLLNGGMNPDSGSPAKLRERRILSSAMFVIIPAIALLMTMNSYMGFSSDNPIIAVSLLSCIVALYVQSYFGRPRFAANLGIFAFFIVLSYFLFQLGLRSTPLYWMFALPAVAVLLTGRRNGLIWALMTVSVIWIVQIFGVFPDQDGSTLGLTIEATLVLFTIALTTVSFRGAQLRAEKDFQRLVDELEREIGVRKSAEKEARDSITAKSAFFAAMSHEIRTPLNGVTGAARLLEKASSSERKEYTKVIIQSGELLLELVNNIMDLSSLEMGKMRLERIPVDLNSVISNAIAPLRFKAEKKGLTFEEILTSPIPDSVFGDPTRIRQILINVIGNAVKFTEKGRVSVELGVANDRLVISVADSGIGIAAEHQAKLFQPFVQAELSTARHFGGSGLGLAITKQLVTDMNGDISMSSIVGEGTTITVELPFEECAEKQAAPTQEESSEMDPLSILLADDNAVNRMVVSRILEQHQHEVVTVQDGQEAVDFVKSHEVDLILMDVQMPGMDGITAMQHIRDMENGSNMPIIALTANASIGESERLVETGFDGYLSKPFKYELLHAAIPPRESTSESLQ